MAGTRTEATGGVPARPVGKPAPTGPVGVAGSTEPDDHGTNTSNRTRSREVPGSAAVDDASGSGRTDGPGLRADHRRGGAVSVREASGEHVGLVPTEESSGDRRRLGHISKQGSSVLRFF